jgi:hypothetical protein
MVCPDNCHDGLVRIRPPQYPRPSPLPQECRRLTWKVLFVGVFGVMCFARVGGMSIVLISLNAADNKWWWFTGLLLGSVIMSLMFMMFLKHADSTFERRRSLPRIRPCVHSRTARPGRHAPEG